MYVILVLYIVPKSDADYTLAPTSNEGSGGSEERLSTSSVSFSSTIVSASNETYALSSNASYQTSSTASLSESSGSYRSFLALLPAAIVILADKIA